MLQVRPWADCLARRKVLPRQTSASCSWKGAFGISRAYLCPWWTHELGEATLPQGSPSLSYTGMKAVSCLQPGSLNTTHVMGKESNRDRVAYPAAPLSLKPPPPKNTLALSNPSTVSFLFILGSWLPGFRVPGLWGICTGEQMSSEDHN